MKLSIFGQELDVSERTIRSDRLLGTYDDLSSYILSGYDADFSIVLKDPKNAPVSLERYAWEKVVAAAEALHKKCLNAGIFDIDIDAIIKAYDEHSGGSELIIQLDDVDDKISDIILAEQDRDEYRRARRLGRARVIGGGFGVKGALEGIAFAGLANTATGIASGTFNLIGKAVTTAAATSKAKDVLIKKKSEVEAALHVAIRSFYGVEVAILHTHDASSYDQETECLARWKQASVIFENSKKAEISTADFDNNVLRCLELDPRGTNYYDYLISRILTKNSDVSNIDALRKLADECGVNFHDILDQTFKKFAKKISEHMNYAEWTTTINHAASTLQYDHSAYANRAVAERFVTCVVNFGIQNFLNDPSLADEIIGQDAYLLPVTRAGILEALNKFFGTDMAKFAKSFSEAALAGDQRCVAHASRNSVILVLGFLNRTDMTTFGLGLDQTPFNAQKTRFLKVRWSPFKSKSWQKS